MGFPMPSWFDPPRRPVPQGRNTAADGSGGVVVNRPTRNTPDADAYLDIQKMAKADGRATDELLALYALEGFLDRLSSSPRADDLVLKGGVVLAAHDTRRPTRDIDLRATRLAGDADTVLALVRDIASVHQDDGLVYDAGSVTAEVIRDEEEYSGVRVRLIAHLSRSRIPFHVDVNVGDPIVPPPGQVEVPQCQRRRARNLHRRGRHAPAWVSYPRPRRTLSGRRPPPAPCSAGSDRTGTPDSRRPEARRVGQQVHRTGRESGSNMERWSVCGYLSLLVDHRVYHR